MAREDLEMNGEAPMKTKQFNLASRVLLLGMLLIFPTETCASARSKAAREAADFVIERFGKEVAKESAETLGRKIESLAVKHGDEAIEAVKKIGPRIFSLVEEVGVHGDVAVKLMARFGDDGVIWVIKKPKSMAIFIKYGEPAAEALVRHKGIAEPLIDGLGRSSITALQKVNSQNGRRIAMMAEEGQWAKIGKTEELLQVIGKYADKAMDFVWRHKAELAVSAVLIAFLADPEPFIEGTKDITQIVTENVAKPAIEAAGRVAEQSVGRANWNRPIWAVVVLAVVLFLCGVTVMYRKRAKV